MDKQQKLTLSVLVILALVSISYQVWKEWDQYKTRKAIQNLNKK